MAYLRHETWRRLLDQIGDISEKYGPTIHDSRCGKSWDCGQALCAEAYGPEWQHTTEFARDDAVPDDEPVPVALSEAAERILRGEADWIEEAK